MFLLTITILCVAISKTQANTQVHAQKLSYRTYPDYLQQGTWLLFFTEPDYLLFQEFAEIDGLRIAYFDTKEELKIERLSFEAYGEEVFLVRRGRVYDVDRVGVPEVREIMQRLDGDGGVTGWKLPAVASQGDLSMHWVYEQLAIGYEEIGSPLPSLFQSKNRHKTGKSLFMLFEAAVSLFTLSTLAACCLLTRRLQHHPKAD